MFRSRSSLFLTAFATSWVHGGASVADIIPSPPLGRNSVIGSLQYTEAVHEDTLIDIARRFDLGVDEIVSANAAVDRWVPGNGTRVMLPKRFVLPDAPQNGIVVNISELRLYYFPQGEKSQVVMTYPVSIGRMDWRTPLGKTTIVKKEKDPPWHPPASIRAEHAAEGEFLPEVFPGGDPDNPLGAYALRLGVPGYLIHGVDRRKANGIGMQVTHGCIRMYPEDIAELFRLVELGIQVTLVDQPVKLGWQNSILYLEIHAPLDIEEGTLEIDEEEVVALVEEHAGEYATVDQEAVRSAVRSRNGVPVEVARTESALPPPRGLRSPNLDE